MGGQIALGDDESEEVDLVRVAGLDGDGLPALPLRSVDDHHQLCGIETLRRVPGGRLGNTLGVLFEPADSGFARADSARVGNRDVIVVERAELENSEQGYA